MKKRLKNWKEIVDRFRRAWCWEDEEVVECLHDSCPKCHGTGVDEQGHSCFHFISCSCPRCRPS